MSILKLAILHTEDVPLDTTGGSKDYRPEKAQDWCPLQSVAVELCHRLIHDLNRSTCCEVLLKGVNDRASTQK